VGTGVDTRTTSSISTAMEMRADAGGGGVGLKAEASTLARRAERADLTGLVQDCCGAGTSMGSIKPPAGEAPREAAWMLVLTEAAAKGGRRTP